MNDFFKKREREKVIDNFKSFFNITDEDIEIKFILDDYFDHKNGLVYCFCVKYQKIEPFFKDELFLYKDKPVYCSFIDKKDNSYFLYFNILNDKLDLQTTSFIKNFSICLSKLSNLHSKIKLVLEDNNCKIYSKEKLDFTFIDILSEKPNYMSIEIIPHKNNFLTNTNDFQYCYLIKKAELIGTTLNWTFPY